MSDFVNWCADQDLVEIHEDGTVMWKVTEECEKKIDHKEKIKGGRDMRDDLSGDYKGHYSHMGKVWPFKIAASKKSCTPKAPVGK